MLIRFNILKNDSLIKKAMLRLKIRLYLANKLKFQLNLNKNIDLNS